MGPGCGRHRWPHKRERAIGAARSRHCEVQFTRAVFDSEHHVFLHLAAEVEDSLPRAAAVPVNPRRDRDVAIVARAGRELHVLVAAVQRDRLAGFPRRVTGRRRPAGCGRVPRAHGVVRVPVEGVARDQRLIDEQWRTLETSARRHRDHLVEVARPVDDIRIGELRFTASAVPTVA